MQNQKDEVLRYFKNLAYLLKGADDDGVEVQLTSDNDLHRETTTTALVKYATAKFPEGGSTSCNMELSLAKLFDRIIRDLPNRRTSLQFPFVRRVEKRPVSIYVLTNGQWTSSYANMPKILEEPIKMLVREIRSRSLRRAHVTLQFIRFGGERADISRLDR